MKVLTVVMGLVAAILPAVGLAQEYHGSGLHAESVIRPAGNWQNYMHVPDGHCGCPTPVRCGDYTECCRPCGLNPCCFFKRVGRMLDCLLPCNKCCGGGCLIGDCHGCGWFKSHCPKRCGYCDHVGCGSVCPSSIDHQPMSSDPFLDDPMQPMPEASAPAAPMPAPDGESRLRRAPSGSRPYSFSRGNAPHHSAGMTTQHPQRSANSGPLARPQDARTKPRPAKVATAPASPTQGNRWIGQSVLRRTSYHEAATEPAMLPGIELDASALPTSTMDLLPPLPSVPGREVDAETDDHAAPRNPLR